MFKCLLQPLLQVVTCTMYYCNFLDYVFQKCAAKDYSYTVFNLLKQYRAFIRGDFNSYQTLSCSSLCVMRFIVIL